MNWKHLIKRRIEMKKFIRWFYIAVICALLGFSATGCWETFTAGFASGAITTESVLKQAEEDLAENIERLNQKNIELEQLLEQTESLEEKAKIRQVIADNEELKRQLTTGKEVTQIAQQGTKTNWNDPTQVSAFGALIISLIMNKLQDRQNKNKDKELLGLNKGIQRFEGTHDKAVAGELHDDIKKEKRKVANGEIT